MYLRFRQSRQNVLKSAIGEVLERSARQLAGFIAVANTENHADIIGQTTADLAKRSEEHTSELQSLMRISYAVFCLKKKKTRNREHKPKNDKQHKRNDKRETIKHNNMRRKSS